MTSGNPGSPATTDSYADWAERVEEHVGTNTSTPESTALNGVLVAR